VTELREREREKEREKEKERVGGEREFVCVCERESHRADILRDVGV